MRNLKGLDGPIGLSVVHWLMGDDGWTFDPGPGVVPDTVNGVEVLRDLYTLDDPECTSRVTVPVLWDKASRQIVSNESSEILRMFNSAFDELGAAEGNRNIENTDIVVWHSFGHTHVCKPEDFPVMPVEYAGFMLKPNGFFSANPADDIAPDRNRRSVLSSVDAERGVAGGGGACCHKA
jgi:hypothetical protein